jgi:AcrR family transcriptional regulator
VSPPPGRKRQLTAEQIVEAVLADGLSTFSLPSIAKHLGVAHSGLYRYFNDRDELVVRAMEHCTSSAEWPTSSLPWREQLTGIGETIWLLCNTYPGYDETVLTASHWPRGLSWLTEPHIESLQRQGFKELDATIAVEFVITLALSTSLAPTRLIPAGSDHGTPRGGTIGRTTADRGTYQEKLDTWLDGLEQRRAETRQFLRDGRLSEV